MFIFSSGVVKSIIMPIQSSTDWTLASDELELESVFTDGEPELPEPGVELFELESPVGVLVELEPTVGVLVELELSEVYSNLLLEEYSNPLIQK